MPSRKLKALVRLAKSLPVKDLAQRDVDLGETKGRAEKPLGGSREKLNRAAKALGR